MSNIYLNPKQHKMVFAPQRYVTGIIGRGGGKTHALGVKLYLLFNSLPTKKGFLLNKSFGQAYTKTLPEMLNVCKKMGLLEHVSDREPGHFVVCRTPPKWWSKPQVKPEKYDNVVTFINGFTLEILSFDRPDLNRGGSYDAGLIDEAALITWDQFEKTILPLTRGLVTDEDHPMRFSTMIVTSRAWKPSGKWTESKMKMLAAEKPNDFAYIEASARDNIHVLGEKYFEIQKNLMDANTYAVEIENQPVSKLPNAYYQDLDDETHLYNPEFEYEYDERSVWHITGERDVDPNLPLEPSFDFNAGFSSVGIFQDLRPEKLELRLLRNHFVKYKTVEDLVDMICDHYEYHPTKIANVYGGKDGFSKFKLHNDYTLYQRIEYKFKQRGWECQICVDVSLADVAHKQKHLVMSNVLREIYPFMPVLRMNEENAKETFMSMLHTPIRGDFQKDKSSESDKSLPQEEATHLSDVVDNYVYTKVLRNMQEEVESTGSSDDWTAGSL